MWVPTCEVTKEVGLPYENHIRHVIHSLQANTGWLPDAGRVLDQCAQRCANAGQVNVVCGHSPQRSWSCFACYSHHPPKRDTIDNLDKIHLDSKRWTLKCGHGALLFYACTRRWNQLSWSHLPTGHTTLLRRWINVNDVDSTSQQHRVPGGYSHTAPTATIKAIMCRASIEIKSSLQLSAQNYIQF